MSLIVLGINHQTAPVGLRERVAFGSDAMPRALAELRAMPAVREVALLSTCNRTELYALADDTGDALAEWLASHPDAGDLHEHLKTAQTPFNRLGAAELCPGSAVLAKINSALR